MTTDPLLPPGVRSLATDVELAELAQRWAALSELALDTEFVFEKTFWPRPGLVQLAANGETALVDAIAISDFAPLARLLLAPTIEKVVHSGSGDALLLERMCGCRPQPLFDTQVAAAFAGLGASLSYAALVEKLLGKKLGKHETRTDWTRRPLSPDQLRYAAEDVADLLEVAGLLRTRLTELGRLDWVREESAAQSAGDPERERPENAWRRLRGFDRLPPRVRVVARELARWRELAARERDLPRGFVLADETLVALARRGALEPAEAKKLPAFDLRRHAAFVPLWIAALADAEAAADSAPPEDEPAPTAPRDELERRDRALAGIVERKAKALELPPELLLSRRQREALLSGGDGSTALSERLTGFRRELFADALADLG